MRESYTVAGRLVLPGREAAGRFMWSQDYWAWTYMVMPKVVGKWVRITLEVIGDEEVTADCSECQ